MRRIRLATAARMPVEHLGRRRAVQGQVGHWGRSDRMAGEEVLAAPVVGERAFARGSIGRLRVAAGGFVALQEEELEGLVRLEGCCCRSCSSSCA